MLVGIARVAGGTQCPRLRIRVNAGEVAEPGFEWVPSGLLSPEFDASFVGGGGPEADREGADEAEVFRALSTSKARWIGFGRHIENRLFSMAHWRRTQARLAYEIQVGEVHGGGQYRSTESHFPTSLKCRQSEFVALTSPQSAIGYCLFI